MIIKENINEDLKSQIVDIETPLNYQWFLYKSALSRQPLSNQYYRDWYSLYSNFYNNIDMIENDDFNARDSIKQFEFIIAKLSEYKLKLKDILSQSSIDVLNPAVDKLIAGVENIISELEEGCKSE